MYESFYSFTPNVSFKFACLYCESDYASVLEVNIKEF